MTVLSSFLFIFWGTQCAGTVADVKDAASALIGLKSRCSDTRSYVYSTDPILFTGEIALTKMYLSGYSEEAVVKELVSRFGWDQSVARETFQKCIKDTRTITEEQYMHLFRSRRRDYNYVPPNYTHLAPAIAAEWTLHGMFGAAAIRFELSTMRFLYTMADSAFFEVLEDRIACMEHLLSVRDNAEEAKAVPIHVTPILRKRESPSSSPSKIARRKREVMFSDGVDNDVSDDRIFVLEWVRDNKDDISYENLRDMGRGYPTRGFRNESVFLKFISRLELVLAWGGWEAMVGPEDYGILEPIFEITRIEDNGYPELTDEEFNMYIEKRIQLLRGV